MIKAEIISHEGNPGPNWLDRCRNLTTPGNISTVIIVVAAIGITVAVLNSRSNIATERATQSAQSTPAAPAKPLTVAPANATTYQNISGNATVQSAAGGAENPVAPSSNATQGIPTVQTPLNNTATTPDASQPSYNQQNGLRGRNLTNKVQSVVPAMDGLRGKLNAQHNKRKH